MCNYNVVSNTISLSNIYIYIYTHIHLHIHYRICKSRHAAFYMGIWLQFHQLQFQQKHWFSTKPLIFTPPARSISFNDQVLFEIIVGEIVVKYPYECLSICPSVHLSLSLSLSKYLCIFYVYLLCNRYYV